ncbi:MAG: leucine-rich repeat domain-containing protein, partial [Bacteroidales bacterium]|nr:leucine-rich repeat domain-containing protein [Candidatus Scybalocola fimicaballi]
MRNFLLLVMMLVTTVANAANLLSKQYIGSVYYNFYDDGHAEATYGTLQSPENYSGDIQIRSKVQLNGKDYTVTAIGEDAFYACSKLTSVNIPTTVKSIGNSAFYGTGITDIDIPNSVISIDDNAFQECMDLVSVSFSNNLSTLGSKVFYNCDKLKSVDLSETLLETFGTAVFARCYKLESVLLPNMLKVLPDETFDTYCSGCSTYLTSIDIPKSVVSIGKSVFLGRRALRNVTLGDNLISIGTDAFYECGFTTLEIPNSVTTIGNSAFGRCSNLENVKLSNSLKEIPTNCFSYCSKLFSVAIPNSVTSINGSAFSSCSKLGSITIPGSVTTIASNAFSSCSQCIVYLCNDKISPSNSTFSNVKRVVSCDNVPMPVEINYAFFYTGKEQLYNIPEHSAYSVTGNRRTEEGTQKVTVKLYDGFVWTNGTSDDIVFDFTIYPAKFTPEQTLINAYLGQKLKDLKLPKGCKWMDSPETVLEYTGENKFSVYYTPDGWTKAPLIIEMTVMVAKIAVELPLEDPTVYEYDGKSHTYQFKETEFYKVSNPTALTQTNAGTYNITVSLKNKAKYMWTSGSTNDLTYKFVIKKQTVTRPEADKTEFVYTGKELTYKLAENPLYTISNNVQTNIGSYSVLVSLKDQSNYMWDNGSSSNQTYSFIINKNGVKIPEADTRMFMYTGEPQTYYIPENDLYTIKNNVQTNVGNYTVTVSLKNKDYYRWSDGSSTDKTYKFNIEKLKVVIPPTYNGSFTYNGKAQTYPIASDNAFVTVIGYDGYTGKYGSDSTQTNAGSYNVILSLKDKTNSMWVSKLTDTYGNSGNQIYTFVINPAEVTSYPAGLDPKELKLETTYGKTLSSITLPSEYKWVTPTTSVGNVGVKTFAANYTPKDSKNYLTTRVNLTVDVKPQPVAEPREDQTLFFYLAKPQKYGIETTDLYTVKNNVQTNVGTYDVVVSLRDKINYVWKTSASSSDLTYKFTISKSNEGVFEAGYNPNEINPKVQYGQKLGEVMLPTRFSWKYPETVATKIGDNKYTVIYTPSDPKNYNSVEVEIVVNVTKRRVAFPEKDSRLFVYTGKAQTYEVGNNSLYKVSNNVQTNAGRYDVKVALIDKEHYEWQDGTIDDIYQDFIIRTKSIEMPSIDSKSFVYDGKSHSLTIPASSFYTVSGNKGVDAGRYEVTLALADKKNYVWENNTTADIVATFSISKIKVEIPAADNTSFAYTGEPHTYKIAASDLYTVSGNVQTKAGNYDVQVSLKDPKNYEWVDGSSNSLIYNFYIKDIVNQSTLEIVNIPSIAKRTFVYDGTSHVLAISDTEKFTVSDEGGIAVGRYAATLSLTDKSKYVWENGSSDDVTIAYVVTKAPVAIPDKDARSFTYNTRNQTYTVAKNSNYTVKNNVQKNAGRYEVVVSLADPKNYEWADGSSDDITMIFKIGKAKVSVPDADATKFTYTGKPQTYTIAKSSMYTVSNNVQTNAGTYDVIVSLTDANNYMWSDGTTNDLSYNFVIRAEQTNVTVVQIPTVTTRSFVYNGKTQTLDIPESEHYIITNNKRVNAGRYVATVALRDPKNSVWSDGTKEDVQYVFNITKAIVDIPEIDHTRFVYTGEAQTYTIPSSEYYTVSGNVQTKVGQYEVVVALDDVKNYMWSDGTVDDLAYNFVIRAEEVEKKEIEIPSIVERKFIYNGKVQTLDIAQNEYYNVFNNKGVDVGRYTVTLSLVDPEMTVWENGSSDDVLLTFTIAKAQVDFPTPDNTQFYYNGDYQTYEIVESPLYVVDNNEQKEAGRYEVNVALKDPKNYEWEDGTFEDLSYSFLISKAQVDEPKADPTKYVYNGKAQSYKIASSPLYSTYGTSQTLPGKYEVLVALNDVRNYEWSNGTTDDLIYNFVIRSVENNKRSVEIPNIETKNFIYDGTTKSLDIASSKDYNVTGNSGVDAGRYTVTLSLTDSKATSWSDGTTDDVKMTFTIAKAQVNVPNSNDSTYFYNEKYQTYEIEHDSLSTLSNNVQKNAGKYVVKLSLVDPKNYEWSDGTIDDVVYNFSIYKEQVAIPAADNSKFIYNGNKQIYKIAADSRYSVDGATQMMPGKYQVLVSLNDANNYEWSNGTTDVLSYNFVIRAEEINKTAVEIPTVLAKKFVYDGSIKYLDIPYSDDYYVVGDTGVNVGRYVSSIVLRDPTKTVWSDGSTDDIYFVFSITKAQVEKPSADNSKFVYDGSDKYYSLYHNAYDFHVYTVYDTIQKNAGRYDVTVSLNDAKNYEWEDGSVDDLNFNFTINKAQVTIPAADATKFIYNGNEQTYKIAANSRYTVEGNKQTMPGKYEVLVSLVDPKNTEWSNGTTDALSYNFVIRAEESELKSISIPSVVAKNFIYDGSVKSLNIASSKDYNVTGNNGIDAGRYTVTLSLTDPIKTVWSDGSTDDVKVVMTIAKAQVEKPSADATKFIYSGKNQVYSLRDSSIYTISNNIQKNAGRYDVTVSLNDAKNYEWSDGSVDDLNYNFTINKAQVEIPAVDVTRFIYNGSEQTYKIAANSRYTVEGNKKTMPGKYEVLV